MCSRHMLPQPPPETAAAAARVRRHRRWRQWQRPSDHGWCGQPDAPSVRHHAVAHVALPLEGAIDQTSPLQARTRFHQTPVRQTSPAAMQDKACRAVEHLHARQQQISPQVRKVQIGNSGRSRGHLTVQSLAFYSRWNKPRQRSPHGPAGSRLENEQAWPCACRVCLYFAASQHCVETRDTCSMSGMRARITRCSAAPLLPPLWDAPPGPQMSDSA